MSGHRLVLHVDDDCFSWGMTCDYATSDEDRPCWPLDFDGKHLPAPQPCNYDEWLENLDECVRAELRIDVELEDVDWVGEAPLFLAGGVTGWSHE